MRKLLESYLNLKWYSQSNALYFLKPLSWLYIFLSNAKYIKPAEKLETPIIVIGNINAGGMGKTPLAIWLAQKFKKSGLKVAVVLKPYRVRKFLGYHFISIDDNPSLYGDEPCMIKNKTEVDVVVTFNRFRTIAQIKHEFDIILLDDGLQDINTARSFNICVTDYMKKFGNKCLLPVGPLRNSIESLINVDEICVRGKSVSIPAYTLEIDGFYRLNDPNKKLMAKLPKAHYIAVSGMAHPEKFHDSLRGHLKSFETLSYSDHHHWKPVDFFQIHNESIVVTEKDAVKLNFEISVDVYVANTIIVPNDHLQTLYTKLLKLISIDDKV